MSEVLRSLIVRIVSGLSRSIFRLSSSVHRKMIFKIVRSEETGLTNVLNMSFYITSI